MATGRAQRSVNDVATMRNWLRTQGFTDQDMYILVDDPSWKTQTPSKANIEAAFRWLASQATPGASLFFHYSGHGSKVPDKSGDEADGFDETIIPVDFRQAGQIVDDDIYNMLVKPLPAGCRLTAVMDCCHSGTAMDLP